MRFEIEPKIGLGDFILGMNINQVLTLIKRNGYKYKHCEIISNKEINTPIFFHIPSEQITLRFNYYSQNLELIEKKIVSLENNQSKSSLSSILNKDSEYYYKNKLFYTLNKESHYYKINYQNIAKIFGLSKVPKKLNNNKNIFLEYSGIGFYFTNINIVRDLEKSENLEMSVENSSVDTESILNKIFIFREDSLYESINNSNICKNNILIKYDTNKPKSITVINEESKSEISIGDHVEDVLRELKHPNYIHYNNDQDENYNNQDNGNVLYDQISDKIYYLNYFQYGFDIMISDNKVCRIILHTNQVNDSKFGIYERCNFKLKLRNDYLKSLLENKNKEIIIKKDSSQIFKNDKELKEKNKSRKNSNNEKILEKERKEKDIIINEKVNNKEEKNNKIKIEIKEEIKV